MKNIFLLALVTAAPLWLIAQNTHILKSPDGNLEVTVETGQQIRYSVKHGGESVILPSPVSMTLDKGRVFGRGAKLSSAKHSSTDQVVPSPFYKRAEICDRYNQLSLNFKEGFRLEFRAYDEGMAYRFVSTLKGPFTVENEEARFDFGTDHNAFIPYVRTHGQVEVEQQFFNSFENHYTYGPLSEWEPDRIAFLPLAIEAGGGRKVCITEADLENYPGMFLSAERIPDIGLAGVFATYPKEEKQGGHINIQMLVTEREGFIAKCNGPRSFPWRIAIISDEDIRLADNDMVYKLSSPARMEDISWIKPGKAAWEWWNDWNLYGVDFKAGLNNETYKYYIDFASRFEIEYVVLDEGWAVSRKADLFDVIPEIDLPGLVTYARERNVGLILWAGYRAFEMDMEQVCRHYSEMGIKGFKIDFMDRDDQKMVDFHYEAAETAARYQLLLDFHGTYKPTGLNRTYPNVINFEGVYGLEMMKFVSSEKDQVTYDVTIPFIRQVAGPMDYTQGAMRNATRQNHHAVNTEAMSQGTRCRQLAQYIVYESPLTMLCDSPSNYIREEECTEFIASVPTVWDETKALSGKIGEYVAIARRSGNEWYVGAMTGWNPHNLRLDLSFVGEGDYMMEIFTDGINAHRAGRDYTKLTIPIPTDRIFTATMAPGGGCAIRIYRK